MTKIYVYHECSIILTLLKTLSYLRLSDFLQNTKMLFVNILIHMDTFYFTTLMSATIEHMYFTFRILSFNNNIHLNHPINLSFLEYKKIGNAWNRYMHLANRKRKKLMTAKSRREIEFLILLKSCFLVFLYSNCF